MTDKPMNPRAVEKRSGKPSTMHLGKQFRLYGHSCWVPSAHGIVVLSDFDVCGTGALSNLSLRAFHRFSPRDRRSDN